MDAKVGEKQGAVTSCYLQEALDKARELFNYERAQGAQRPAQRHEGTRHRRRPGVPSGRLHGLRRPRAHHARRQDAHCTRGVGNLGTYSHTGTSRVAAEVLKANWDNCIVERGDTPQGLALEHRPVRQQHVVHDGAHELRRGRWTPSRSSRRSPRWISAARRPTTTSAASACS